MATTARAPVSHTAGSGPAGLIEKSGGKDRRVPKPHPGDLGPEVHHRADRIDGGPKGFGRRLVRPPAEWGSSPYAPAGSGPLTGRRSLFLSSNLNTPNTIRTNGVEDGTTGD